MTVDEHQVTIERRARMIALPDGSGLGLREYRLSCTCGRCGPWHESEQDAGNDEALMHMNLPRLPPTTSSNRE